MASDGRQFAGKYALVYEALKDGGDPNKDARLQKMPAALRRRLLIDFSKRIESANTNFELATAGTILDPTRLIDARGNTIAPHMRAVAYGEETHKFVMGDIQFSINPTNIRIDDESHHTKNWVLRSRGMTKNKSGRGVIACSVTLPFVGYEEINFKLRRLVAFIRTLPILYVDNELLRQHVWPDSKTKNMACCVTHAVVLPMQGVTNTLLCQLSMEVFNYLPFSDDFYFLFGPAALLFQDFKLSFQVPGAPKATTIKLTPEELIKPISVKRPSQSPLFSGYYDAILGDLPIGSGEPATQVPSKRSQHVASFSDNLHRYYNFQKTGAHLDSTIKFTYHIYHTIRELDVKRVVDKKQSGVDTPSPVVGRPDLKEFLLPPKTYVPDLSGAQRLGSRTAGSITGRRLMVADLMKVVESFKGIPYKKHVSRDDPTATDCSSFVYQAFKKAGIGNIGVWGYGQVRELERLNLMGLRAWLRVRSSDGYVLVPMPLEIASFSESFSTEKGPARTRVMENTRFILENKIMGLPGVILHAWGFRSLYRHSGGEEVFAPEHALIGHHIDNSGGVYVIDNRDVVEVRKMRHSGLPKTKNAPLSQWERAIRPLNWHANTAQSAYFAPNVIYDYEGPYQSIFDAIMSIETKAWQEVKARVKAVSQLMPAQAADTKRRDALLTRLLSQPAPVPSLSDALIDGPEPLASSNPGAFDVIKKQVATYYNKVKSGGSAQDVAALRSALAQMAKANPQSAAQIQEALHLQEQISRRTGQLAGLQNTTQAVSSDFRPEAGARIPNDVKWFDAEWRKNRTLEMAKEAAAHLKKWFARIQTFLKTAAGWQLVWMKDGAAILRRPVTLSIEPGNPVFMDDGQPHYMSLIAPVVSMSNIFARLPLLSHRLATHQFLGSGDSDVTLTFQAVGNGIIGQLKYMHAYCEAATRFLRRVPEIGVIHVQNDVVNLCGSSQYIIDDINTENVEGSPGTYIVTVKLTEWKKDQDKQARTAQEYHTSLDTRLAYLKELGRLFSTNNGFRTQVTVRRPLLVFTYATSALQFMLLNQFPITFKDVVNRASAENLAMAQAKQQKVELTALRAAYVAFAPILASAAKHLWGTRIFEFLGYSQQDLLDATRDSSHPFYLHGFFDIFLVRDSSLDDEFMKPGRDLSKSLDRLVLDRFLERARASIDVENNSLRHLSSTLPDYQSRSALSEVHTYLHAARTSIASPVRGLDELVKKLPAQYRARMQQAIRSADRLRQSTKLIEGQRLRSNNVSYRQSFIQQAAGLAFDSAGDFGLVGFLGQLLKDVSQTRYWFPFVFGSNTDPNLNYIRRGLGPNAAYVRQTYGDVSFRLVGGIQTDPNVQGTVRSTRVTNITLQQEVELEQIRASAALVAFFRNMRREIEALAVNLQRVLQLDPSFQKIFSQEDADNLAYGGLPAYQDIPLARLAVQQIQPSQSPHSLPSHASQYRWANPDFYWFNPDDYGILNMERLARTSAQAMTLVKSSRDFAEQFGMMPLRKEEADAFNRVAEENKRTFETKQLGNKAFAGRPGVYAYLGSRTRWHGSQLSGDAGASLARNLPETLALEMGYQALSRTSEGAKGAAGYLNLGISDAGISQEKKIASWYLDQLGSGINEKAQALRMSRHPLGLTNVTFGPAGLSELRLPVLLDRRPENLMQQFLRSTMSYRRNVSKMRRALPACKLYFIEDDTSGYFKTDQSSMLHSYDDFFSYSAVKEIKFIASRKIPADMLIVRLSNTLGYLDTLEFDHANPGTVSDPDQRMPVASNSDRAREKQDPLMLDTELENPFTRFILKAGVRVQFKFGYENNPDDMDRIFNGQIVQINQVSADEIAIVCQSFGTQLVAYQKGLSHESIPKTWVDTFELLSWAISQPEMTYFGRWSLDSQFSIGESRSTGGWEKVFRFLADPRDDNIFTPARHEMIRLIVDDHGGIWSFLKSLNLGASSAALQVHGKDYVAEGAVKFVRSVGDSDVYLVKIKNLPLWDLADQGIRLSGKSDGRYAPLVVERNKSNPNLKPGQSTALQGKKVVSFYSSYGRGDSKILDYHVYRTTIWDIFKEMELRHPGWIARPVPYGNRMTMFFGQPNQLYWSRPMTALERLEQLRSEREIREKILKDKYWSDIYRRALGFSNSWTKTAEKIPIIGWAVKNPLDAILWGSIMIPATTAIRAGLAGLKAAGASIGGGLIAGAKLQLGRAIVSGTTFAASALTLRPHALRMLGRGATATFGNFSSFSAGLNTIFNWGAAGALGFGAGVGLYKQFYKSDAILAQSLLSVIQSHFAQHSLRKSLAGRLIPFRRYHMVTSEHHIIANNIKASTHGTYNAVSLEYTADHEAEVDLASRGKTETKTMKASDRILDKDVRMGHFSYPNCRGRWMADRYMQGLLMRYMKDTYKGSLLILADGNIQPHDRVMIFDSYSEMYGGIDVEQVVLTISPEIGAVTEITPDLVLYGNNIVDMPYDDYMAAKLSFDEMSWREAINGAIRFNGSQLQKRYQRHGGQQPGHGSVADAKYANRYIEQWKIRRAWDKDEGSFWSLLGHAGVGLLTGAALAAGGLAGAGIGAAIYATRRITGSTTWKELIPFWGTMAIKFYEWTTQRQPLIFQPLFVGGRPLIAGVDMDKVDMVQHISDQFVPIRRAANRGISLLSNLGGSILNQQVTRTVSSFPLGPREGGPSDSSSTTPSNGQR